MVSLLSLIARRNGLRLLTTGIGLLDSIIFDLQKLHVYDFQSAPGSDGMTHVLVELIISHLTQKTTNRVVVIETLGSFPWATVKRHPRYSPLLLENGIVIYDASTYSQLYAIFAHNQLDHLGDDGLHMVIIYNYHELLEQYKLELFATYEETLLRFHIHRNDVFLSNATQLETTGKTTSIPSLPSDSGLLRSSPVAKFEAHVVQLVRLIYKFSQATLQLCILAGGVDSKYHIPQTPTSSVEVPSSSPTPPPSSFKSSGRMILTSFTGTTDTSALELCIKIRLLFYKTWLHNTPAFKSSYTGGPREIKLVLAVRVDNFYKQRSTFKYFDDCDNSERNFVREITTGPARQNPTNQMPGTTVLPFQPPQFAPAATSTQLEDIPEQGQHPGDEHAQEQDQNQDQDQDHENGQDQDHAHENTYESQISIIEDTDNDEDALL